MIKLDKFWTFVTDYEVDGMDKKGYCPQCKLELHRLSFGRRHLEFCPYCGLVWTYMVIK